MKLVIHKLVGMEKNGFIVGWSSFDNIVTVQEIMHSLEFEPKPHQQPSPPLPKMLIKVDIEKAYDDLG